MKFSIGNFAFDMSESLDRYVESLVPLKATGKQNNELFVRSSSRMPREHLGIDMIDEDRALFSLSGSPNHSFIPKMVRYNDMINKACGQSFNRLQEPDIRRLEPGAKLIPKEFRYNVVNIENQFCAGHLWIPGGKNQEVRHVMDVDYIIPVLSVQPG